MAGKLMETDLGSASVRGRSRRWRVLVVEGLILLSIAWLTPSGAPADAPATSEVAPARTRAPSDSPKVSTGRAVQHSAIQAIPLDKLDPASRAKVATVISNVSLFRRLPIEVFPCDPQLYLFLLEHPDVVVNIWQVLGISRLSMQQTGPAEFRLADDAGTTGTVQLLYRDQNTHVAYAEGSYRGPLFGKPIHGRVLIVLKSGYIGRSGGRYYVTSRLDAFTQIDELGAEIITKTIQPLVGKAADANFSQTAAFVSTLSRTAEVNRNGMQRLARKLSQVQPEVRDQFAQIADQIAQKAAANPPTEVSSESSIAERPPSVEMR